MHHPLLPALRLAVAELLRAAGVVLILGACHGAALSTARAAPPTERESTRWIWGVTVDDVVPLDATVDSLAHLGARPTTRIVFDEGRPAADYVEATTAIHRVSDVMGELLDSMFVKDVDVARYRRRAEEYIGTLGKSVDIWEIGNEANGDWLGPRAEVAAKVTAAYDAVVARGGRTALTFHHSAAGCTDPDHEMFAWIDANASPELRTGLSYVFVSYYEDDCAGPPLDWERVFDRLGATFPRARLGIGECGTEHADRKAAYLERYYRLRLAHPRFVGGFFWWYFSADMVPREKPLWAALDALIGAAPR